MHFFIETKRPFFRNPVSSLFSLFKRLLINLENDAGLFDHQSQFPEFFQEYLIFQFEFWRWIIIFNLFKISAKKKKKENREISRKKMFGKLEKLYKYFLGAKIQITSLWILGMNLFTKFEFYREEIFTKKIDLKGKK